MRRVDDNQQHRTLVHCFCAISVQMRSHYKRCWSNSEHNKIGCTDPWDFLETHKSRQDLVYTANISYNPASLHWTRYKNQTLCRDCSRMPCWAMGRCSSYKKEAFERLLFHCILGTLLLIYIFYTSYSVLQSIFMDNPLVVQWFLNPIFVLKQNCHAQIWRPYTNLTNWQNNGKSAW